MKDKLKTFNLYSIAIQVGDGISSGKDVRSVEHQCLLRQKRKCPDQDAARPPCNDCRHAVADHDKLEQFFRQSPPQFEARRRISATGTISSRYGLPEGKMIVSNQSKGVRITEPVVTVTFVREKKKS